MPLVSTAFQPVSSQSGQDMWIGNLANVSRDCKTVDSNPQSAIVQPSLAPLHIASFGSASVRSPRFTSRASARQAFARPASHRELRRELALFFGRQTREFRNGPEIRP